MTPPYFKTDSNSAQLWPKQTIATPLKGVSIELSAAPLVVTVMFDVLQLLEGGKGAGRAAKAAAPAAQAVTKGAAKFAAKSASKIVTSAAKPVVGAGGGNVYLEGLKTFLTANPSLSLLAPILDFATLLGRISPLH